MTTITLLHTSDAHVPTFEALQRRLGPKATLVQIVRQDWLENAMKHGLDDQLGHDIAQTIVRCEGTVICTCTTIGPAAVDAGAIRVDAPMMSQAAQIGGRTLLVYALESTKTASATLLADAFLARGKNPKITHLFCAEYWPLFETGENEAFAAGIAGSVRQALTEHPADCVVLAQASMSSAAAHLTDLAIPVLTSPESAMRAALMPKSD